MADDIVAQIKVPTHMAARNAPADLHWDTAGWMGGIAQISRPYKAAAS